MTTLTNKMDALPRARRREIERRAKVLVAEEMSRTKACKEPEDNPARDS